MDKSLNKAYQCYKRLWRKAVPSNPVLCLQTISEPTAASPGGTGLGQVTEVAVRAEHIHPGWSAALPAFLQAAGGETWATAMAVEELLRNILLSFWEKVPTLGYFSLSQQSLSVSRMQWKLDPAAIRAVHIPLWMLSTRRPEAMVASCNHSFAC